MKHLPKLHLLLLVVAWLLAFLWGPLGFLVVGAWLLAAQLLLWGLDLTPLPRLQTRLRDLPDSVRLGELPSYDDVRHAVDMGAHSGREFDFGMRRHLTRIAAARLTARRGIDLHREPEQAHALLGDRLWHLVDPRRPVSTARVGAGVPTAELAELVDRLERL